MTPQAALTAHPARVIAARGSRTGPKTAALCTDPLAAVKLKYDPDDLPNTGFEHIFEMRDGKVVRFQNKPDDAEAWVAGWTS